MSKEMPWGLSSWATHATPIRRDKTPMNEIVEGGGAIPPYAHMKKKSRMEFAYALWNGSGKNGILFELEWYRFHRETLVIVQQPKSLIFNLHISQGSNHLGAQELPISSSQSLRFILNWAECSRPNHMILDCPPWVTFRKAMISRE